MAEFADELVDDSDTKPMVRSGRIAFWRGIVMSSERRILLGAVVVVCSVIGCRDSGAPTRVTLNGSFTLSRLNGRPLPDTDVVLPPAHPGGATCALLGTSGALLLNSATGTFKVTVNAVNSCVGGEYLYLTEAGTYSQHDTELSMSEPFLITWQR